MSIDDQVYRVEWVSMYLMERPIPESDSYDDRQSKAYLASVLILFNLRNRGVSQISFRAHEIRRTKSISIFWIPLDQPLNPNTSFARLMHLSAER